MRKKVFDIKTGHYILLEDISQDTSQSTEAQPNQNKQDRQNEIPTNKSVESNKDIQLVNQEIANENKKYESLKSTEDASYNKIKQTQTTQLNAAMAAVKDSTGSYDAVATNKDVLTIRKTIAELELNHIQKICHIELEHAQNVHKIEMKRIEVLNNMANESFNKLPGKYSALNESNVHNAKIYLDTLVGDNCLLTGMPDFKNAFKDSDLVYGKDKKGYFALCIDRDDFEKLYNVLNAVGYQRDEVFSLVMSQVLDRSEMINAGN